MLDRFSLTLGGTEVRLEFLHRNGVRPALVCLHGFGSTKEDYADLALHPEFADRTLVAIDAPGFGASQIEEPTAVSIPLHMEAALAVCDRLDLDRFHLCGHSMGGLAALLLADQWRDRVMSLTSIEGNLMPEDCFLSRQILDFPAESPEAFLAGFTERVRHRPDYSAALYAAGLAAKVQADAVAPVFRSLVELSDRAPLMSMLAGLPCPRMFVHGDQNRHLSYLEHLREIGVEVVEIAASGHFPMYSNPPELWARMAAFLRRCES